MSLNTNVSQLYAKSDNTGCYHSNYSAEGLHQLCQEKGIKLLRYDYNEPSCGKDQCDRESAAAKLVMRSYVDAGNNVLSASDIHDALHYGSGLKDSKVCVIEINPESVKVEGQKIKNISHYHSVEFKEDKMTFWRYFDVGEGVDVAYSEMHVASGAVVKVPFSSTCRESKKKMFSKPRADRQLCKLLFCPESGCGATFTTYKNYEEHMIIDNHDVMKHHSSMDLVRQSYVDKMKLSSMTSLPLFGNDLEIIVKCQHAMCRNKKSNFCEYCH